MLIRSVPARLLLAFLQAASSAQTPARPTPVAQSAASPSLADSPTPTDPKELLDLARKVNGLSGPDVQPWHLKASFELFDNDGKSKDKGTYEEWWVGDKQYKRVYASTEFSQTEYGTDHGLLLSGNPNWPSGMIASVRTKLVDPTPGEQWIGSSDPKLSDRDFGPVKLHCVSMVSKIPPKGNGLPPVYPSYCFGPQKPMLRYESGMNHFDDTLFNKLVIFRGRYVAGDTVSTNMGKTSLTVHLESLAPFNAANVAELQPPADAVPAPERRINVSPEVMAERIITKVAPLYPQGAKALRLEGVVAIQAVIGKDGHIKSNLRVMSGLPQLQGAAADAVRQWVYEPYLLAGEPVEVGTLIYVVFSLGGR
jgi:hypothetical protein